MNGFPLGMDGVAALKFAFVRFHFRFRILHLRGVEVVAGYFFSLLFSFRCFYLADRPKEIVQMGTWNSGFCVEGGKKLLLSGDGQKVNGSILAGVFLPFLKLALRADGLSWEYRIASSCFGRDMERHV